VNWTYFLPLLVGCLGMILGLRSVILFFTGSCPAATGGLDLLYVFFFFRLLGRVVGGRVTSLEARPLLFPLPSASRLPVGPSPVCAPLLTRIVRPGDMFPPTSEAFHDGIQARRAFPLCFFLLP